MLFLLLCRAQQKLLHTERQLNILNKQRRRRDTALFAFYIEKCWTIEKCCGICLCCKKEDATHMTTLEDLYYGKVVQNDKGFVGMDVTKTKSSYRTLTLIPQVEEVPLAEKEKQEEMQRVMRRGYCKKYTDYICVDAIGELIKPNYVTDHFKVVLKEKGLKAVRFHDLRHSCASLLLANGVPMKMIQDWLGHSDMGTTANIYSHIDSESKKASVMAIGSALS